MQKISPSDLRLPSAADRSVPASAGTPGDPKCPVGVCDGTGWCVQPVAGSRLFPELVPCACRIAAREAHDRIIARARRNALLAQLESELGGKLSRCTLDNYSLEWAVDAAARATMKAALESCRRYAGQPKNWLYIHGPVGVGKSHLAAATARQIAEQHDLAASYTTEPAMIAFLRSGWGKAGDQSADARMEALQTCDLLVLDDIGAAFRGKGEQAWVDAQLFELLQPRYLNSRLTILTSNLPPQDLEPRLASRIRGEAVIIAIDNTDQREVKR